MLIVAATAMVVVGAMPLAFPPQQNAFFFSHALVEPRQPLGLIDVYVPSNPFNALANSIIPAVVLFSSAVGLALIGLENKQGLLAGLRVLEGAIVRITNFVIRTTPFGVFAIAAVTAGTMDVGTFQRLEAYFVAFIVAALLLGFVILPMIVMIFTPFSYRQVVGVAKDALLTAFVAQSVFIVLPILVERIEALLERQGLRTPETISTVRVLVPISFIVPNAGQAADAAVRSLLLRGLPAIRSAPADYGASVRRRLLRLFRQGAGGAALPDGSRRRTARPVPALHSDHHRHRQVRFDGLRDEHDCRRTVRRGRRRRSFTSDTGASVAVGGRRGGVAADSGWRDTASARFDDRHHLSQGSDTDRHASSPKFGSGRRARRHRRARRVAAAGT